MRRKFCRACVRFFLALPYLWDRFLAFFWKGSMGHCGDNVKIRPSKCDIKGLANLYVGDDVIIPRGATFYCTRARLTIGDKVLFGPNPTVITGDHRTDLVGKFMADVTNADKAAASDLPVVIESDVWCGANVTILKGVTVGRGCVVAAGAVVTKDMPPYHFCGGIPAKPIKPRFTVDQILEHERILYSPEDRLSRDVLAHLFSEK